MSAKFGRGSMVVFTDRFGQRSDGQIIDRPWEEDGEWWYEVVDLNTPDGDRCERAESDLKGQP